MPFSFILLAFLAVGASTPVTAASGQSIDRQIEAILRAQDSRDANAPPLKDALISSNRRLRYQGLLAYASIQDTAALARLLPLLEDPDSTVCDMAAVAVGQTAMLMSPAGRAQLMADLYPQLIAGKCPPRLIEELGKVVTQADLDTLVAICKRQNASPRIEAINAVARAAIRGVVTESATRFVLAAIDAEKTPWQVAYALQRIGNCPEVAGAFESLTDVGDHPDPLFRMNLTVLSGKLTTPDPISSSPPLLFAHLSARDEDWRVRVSALRAFAGQRFVERDDIPSEAEFLDDAMSPDLHIAVTAMTTLGLIQIPTGPDSMQIERGYGDLLSTLVEENLPWQVRAEAALAWASRAGERALDQIFSTTAENDRMRAKLIQAWGATGSLRTLDSLAVAAASGRPLVTCAALEALQSLVKRHPAGKTSNDRAFHIALQSLHSPDMAIRTTAASLLGDSLLARPAAVEPLLAAGKKVKLPDDIEVLQQIVTTLGTIGDKRAIPFLRAQLASGEPGVGEVAAKAIGAITGTEPPVLRDKPRNTRPDFAALRLLPDTVHIRMTTSQGTILCELYPRLAPFTVVSFVKLARKGFYNGLVFHRVVPNFVVQGGDPRGDGWGGPGYTIRSEFSPLRFETGTLGMASAGKDTEGSQFFITHSPQPHLDGRYTVFGRVIEGMDVVDKLQIGDTIRTIQISDI